MALHSYQDIPEMLGLGTREAPGPDQPISDEPQP